MAKRCIFILLDGIGDRAYPELGHRTPLEAARTPFLDQLAARGSNGLYHAGRVGEALPSENAHFRLFGYDMEAFPGRGALEALGAGIHICDADVALLAHFVSFETAEDGVLVLADGKPDFSDFESRILFDTVNAFTLGGVRVRFVQTHGLNGIITLRGDVSPFVTDADPFINGRAIGMVRAWADYRKDRSSRQTAAILNDYLIWSHRLLRDIPVNADRRASGRRPINGIVTQRAGRLKPVVSFYDRYGLKGLSIASGIVYMGLAAYIGMDARKVTDSGDAGKDLAERVGMARAVMDEYDFIHVHTKAPDAAAHSKSPAAKQAAIESLDSGLAASLGPLMSDPDTLLVIASDHSTPSSGPLIHSGEPVPILFYGRGVRRDRVTGFDEIRAAEGALGFLRGKEVLLLILNYLDRVKLQGIMDTPYDQPYWPGVYKPLRVPNSSASKNG